MNLPSFFRQAKLLLRCNQKWTGLLSDRSEAGSPVLFSEFDLGLSIASSYARPSSLRSINVGAILAAETIQSARCAFGLWHPQSGCQPGVLLDLGLIEEAFGDLPLAAIADRRVRGEFKA
jgi:hypothetical protein